ncbi:hypothetical protein JCM10908_000112 [Rhodotorula pacifica]|uniref:uncharacterized protein n=1 Tax=Rhodotorula pacifica TaxID=1495444 RepID=UPI0031759BB3
MSSVVNPLVIDPHRNPALFELIKQETTAYRNKPALPPVAAQPYDGIQNDQTRKRAHVDRALATIAAPLHNFFQPTSSDNLFYWAWNSVLHCDSIVFEPAVHVWQYDGQYSAVELYLSIMNEFADNLRRRFGGQDSRYLSPHALESNCQACIAFLLSKTPTAMLERMRRTDPTVPCPRALWQHSYEQPHLPPAFHYAPPLLYPTMSPTQAVLPWQDVNGTFVPGASILQHIFEITQNVLQLQHEILDPTELNRIVMQANDSPAWLASQPVKIWYENAVLPQKAAFGHLLQHIAEETRRIGATEGCFITLNYVVSSLSSFGFHDATSD